MKNIFKIRNQSFKRGALLIEVLVALAIFGVVLIALGAFQVNVFSYKNSISETLQTSQNAQTILKTMLVELREMAPGANGAYPIAAAGSTTLSFFSDYDNDGLTEKITYTLMGTIMYRATIEPTGNPVVYSLANQATSTIFIGIANGNTLPVFQYFDANYTGTSSPLALPVSITKIKLIRVNEKMDISPDKAPVPVIYTVQAGLRNLKDNL